MLDLIFHIHTLSWRFIRISHTLSLEQKHLVPNELGSFVFGYVMLWNVFEFGVTQIVRFIHVILYSDHSISGPFSDIR
jgi:hypothetical protein